MNHKAKCSEFRDDRSHRYYLAFREIRQEFKN